MFMLRTIEKVKGESWGVPAILSSFHKESLKAFQLSVRPLVGPHLLSFCLPQADCILVRTADNIFFPR